MTEFLTPADIPKPTTYLQGMSLLNDAVLVGNRGVCCPGIGTPGGGEGLFTIDYRVSPPQFREWWETFSNSVELWETIPGGVAESDAYPFLIVGEWTRRPAAASLQDGWKDSHVWMLAVSSLDTPHYSYPWSVGLLMNEPDTIFWPQAILDYDGQRWLIVQYAKRDGTFGLARLCWPTVPTPRTPFWTPTSSLTTDPSVPFFSGIVIDTDGSWIACSGWWPAQTNTTVFVWRSRDSGKTWANTGIKFEYPGHNLFGCGWSHTGHGAAAQPWRLTCTSAVGGSGPTDGSWHAVTIAVAGAAPVPHLGEKPVKYTPAPTPSGP